MDRPCRRTSLQALLLLALAHGVIALAWAGIAVRHTLLPSAAPVLEPDMCLVAPPTPYDPELGLPLGSPRAVPADARCPVCGMYPTRAPEWAAQVIFSNGDAQFFDSPASLFTYLHDVSRYTAGHTADQIIASYVSDADCGRWLPALSAVYVQGSSARGPMRTGNLPAFVNVAAAQRFADLCGGVVPHAAEITPDVLPRPSNVAAHAALIRWCDVACLMEQIKPMDFCPGLGVNHSNSTAIARICNDTPGEKMRFYVPDSVQHHTNDRPAAPVCQAAV